MKWPSFKISLPTTPDYFQILGKNGNTIGLIDPRSGLTGVVTNPNTIEILMNLIIKEVKHIDRIFQCQNCNETSINKIVVDNQIVFEHLTKQTCGKCNSNNIISIKDICIFKNKNLLKQH